MPEMHVNVGGTNKRVTQPYVRVGGAWKSVRIGWVNVAGAWKRFYIRYIAPTVGLSPLTATGFGTGVGTVTVTSDPVSSTVFNGEAPFSYQWAFVSGDNTITRTTPTAPSTTFSSSVAPNQTKNATFELTVTDAMNNTATAQVAVELSNSL